MAKNAEHTFPRNGVRKGMHTVAQSVGGRVQLNGWGKPTSSILKNREETWRHL